jgi:hypothetical protein
LETGRGPAHNAAMSDCLFTAPLGSYGLIGLVIGVAVGAALKYGTALRNPKNPDVDATMGQAIYAFFGIAGCVLGVTVQVMVEGCK